MSYNCEDDGSGFVPCCCCGGGAMKVRMVAHAFVIAVAFGCDNNGCGALSCTCCCCSHDIMDNDNIVSGE